MAADRPLVLITEHLDEGAEAWLAERFHVERVRHDTADFADRLPEAEGLVIRTYTIVDAAMLDRAPKLRVVGRAGVGLDNVDLDACRGRGVAVVYTPDANTQAVVEYVLGLMLDAVRPRTDLPPAPGAGAETFHALRKTEVGRQLDTMTLGILGFGRIGKRLGRAAHALGVNLKVCDLLPEPELRQAVSFPFDYVSHERLYADSDIVTVHTDGRPANRHLIGRDALAHFRADAILINAARGMLIDHDALAAWLRAHPDARAVLDVHDPEPPPPPPEYPLHGLTNARLLPHLASRTPTAMANMSWVVKDVAAVLDGKPPRYPAVKD